MYDIGPATLEDFLKVCEGSFEETKYLEDEYKGFEFDKLTYDGEPIVAIGWIPVIEVETKAEQIYMACAISKKALEHKRAICIAGHDYMKFFAKQAPLRVICEHGNQVFSKFAERFGFKKTNFVEKNPESGIIYDVYIRSQE